MTCFTLRSGPLSPSLCRMGKLYRFLGLSCAAVQVGRAVQGVGGGRRRGRPCTYHGDYPQPHTARRASAYQLCMARSVWGVCVPPAATRAAACGCTWPCCRCSRSPAAMRAVAHSQEGPPKLRACLPARLPASPHRTAPRCTALRSTRCLCRLSLACPSPRPPSRSRSSVQPLRPISHT